MAWQQHSPMPETDAEAMMLQYNRELRAAEARDRLEEDVESAPRRHPVRELLARVSRIWRKPDD